MIDFEWDNEKAFKNKNKHGVKFEEAMSIFSDPLEVTIVDPEHSIGEYRFISIGLSKENDILVVSYSEPIEDHIRIISARRASKKEKYYYEQKH